MNIYLVGSITGKSYRESVAWRKVVGSELSDAGFGIFDPMKGGEHLKHKRSIKPVVEESSLLTNHGIVIRDKFYVEHSDIILANFLGAEKASIGSVMELGWAYQMGKFVVTVMESSNIHNHGFVYEASSLVVRSMDEAIDFIISTFGG